MLRYVCLTRGGRARGALGWLRRAVAPSVARAGSAPLALPAPLPTRALRGRHTLPSFSLYVCVLSPQPASGGRKIAGWEWSFIVFVGAIVWGGVAISRQPSQAPIYEWARDEAEERLRRRILGLPVEFGYNYAALRGELLT